MLTNTHTHTHTCIKQNSSLITAALRFLEGEPMDKEILKKWLNLVLLVAAGVYGTSLLITVDMDNWRGWTLQEIMLRIPCKCLNKMVVVALHLPPFSLSVLSNNYHPSTLIEDRKSVV